MTSVFKLSKDYSEDPNALQVIVTAHQYWWEFEYPQLGITTSQELVVPTDKVISITESAGCYSLLLDSGISG